MPRLTDVSSMLMFFSRKYKQERREGDARQKPIRAGLWAQSNEQALRVSRKVAGASPHSEVGAMSFQTLFEFQRDPRRRGARTNIPTGNPRQSSSALNFSLQIFPFFVALGERRRRCEKRKLRQPAVCSSWIPESLNFSASLNSRLLTNNFPRRRPPRAERKT